MHPHPHYCSKFFIFSMAPLFLILLISLTSPFAHSRTTPNIPKTTILHVTASIQKTHQILTTNPHQKQTSSFSSPSSKPSRLSLPLHSRASIQKPSSYVDYKSLTLSRLARDSARVTSLLTPSQLQGPVTSGAAAGLAEYFAEIGIGEPPSASYMILDTGSDVTWVQCAPCERCYHQLNPIFNPNSSSSYSPLSCDSPLCESLDQSQCSNGDSCLYQVEYGDGSFTVGDFVTETVTLGTDSVTGIAIGCGHNNQGLFTGAAGVLGLGGGSLSFTAQLNTTSFSYCLVDYGSESASTLEFDTPFPSNAVTAPLRFNPNYDTFYYVELVGIGVAGELLPIPESVFQLDHDGNGGFIVDSGTAVTMLQNEVYNLLRDAFKRETERLPAAEGVSILDTCYDLSTMTNVAVPIVSFHFPEGKVLELPAISYLIPVDSEGTFCFAFAPTNSTVSIIGNFQQQRTRVSFDLDNSLVGFSVDSC